MHAHPRQGTLRSRSRHFQKCHASRRPQTDSGKGQLKFADKFVHRMLRPGVVNADDRAGREVWPEPHQLMYALNDVAIEPGEIDRFARHWCPRTRVAREHLDWKIAAARTRERGERGITLERHESAATIGKYCPAYGLGRVSMTGACLEREPRLRRTH